MFSKESLIGCRSNFTKKKKTLKMLYFAVHFMRLIKSRINVLKNYFYFFLSRFDGQVPQRADLLEFEDVGVESVLILSGPGRASPGPTLVACGLKDGGVSLSSVEGEEGLIKQMRRITLGGGRGGGGGEVSSLCRLPSSPYAFLAVAAAGGAFVVDAEDGAGRWFTRKK